jgi:glycosyltransferase involved in cell wall biosynthesis
MKVAFIRGQFLNNFEGQNFDFHAYPDVHFTGYSSLHPIDDGVPFPVIKLPSLSDLAVHAHAAKMLRYVSNRSIGDAQVLFGLERHIKGSDIVHTADPHYYYSYQAAKMKSKGLIGSLIVTWWETIPFNNESTRAKRKIKAKVMQEADMFLCYTQKAKDCLLAEGVHENRIHTVSLGVDIRAFHPPSVSRTHPFTILFVGRLVQEKGVMDIYQAFSKTIAKELGSSRLHIVGAGPLHTPLLRMIERDGLQDRVTIKTLAYEEMQREYHNASLLVLASRRHPTWEEQLGMVLLEGMASGVPIVATNTGAIAEIVGEAGIIVPEHDLEELSRAISCIALDKKLAAKLGTMGRNRAINLYDAKHTAENIYRLYQSLIHHS